MCFLVTSRTFWLFFLNSEWGVEKHGTPALSSQPWKQRCRSKRYYCSTFFLVFFFVFFLFTHPTIQICAYGPILWAVWKENISASGLNTPKELLRRITSPFVYSIFIYLLTRANLYSHQEGLTRSVLLPFFCFTLDIHTAGCSRSCTKLPRRMVKG